MKPFLAFVCLMFIGCAPSVVNYTTRSFNLNSFIETTPGEALIQWESGKKITTSGWKYDRIRKSLIYGGIVANVIKVSYREDYIDGGTGGETRQPVYQELQYNLNQSPMMIFQDIKIRVESASLEKLRFKVLQPPAGFRWAEKDTIQ